MLDVKTYSWENMKDKYITVGGTQIQLNNLSKISFPLDELWESALKQVLELYGLSDVVVSGGSLSFDQDSANSPLKIRLNTTSIVGSVSFLSGKIFWKTEQSGSSATWDVVNGKIDGLKTGTFYLGYVAFCMDKYSAYRNMKSGIDPLKWAQNCVLQEISDPTNNTTSLTNNSAFLAWTSLGKYYITNKQLQYFSVPTVAGEVQWGNELDSQGGWFVFDEKQDFGLAEQSEPKNFALVNSTDIPDQIIFENFSNNSSPTITWVDSKTIKINDSSFYIGEKGKVMVIKRGSAQTRTVSHELKDCSFWSSWGTFKKNRTIYSKITTEWNSNNSSTAPSRPDSKKVDVSLSSFSLQQGQLTQGQTSLSAITYSTISSHKLLTTTSQTQEINKDLSLPRRTSSLRVDGYVPQDPAFYMFVGETATITSTGGNYGGGSSKSFASAYLRLRIQVTDLPIIKDQDTWLSASIGELYSDGHYVNDQITYEGDYEHYLYNLWDLTLNPGLLNKDIDIYGKKADTIQYRTWLNTAYMYFPKNSSTKYVFQETKGNNDYTSSVYCGLGFLNNSDDYAYCIYITYTE